MTAELPYQYNHWCFLTRPLLFLSLPHYSLFLFLLLPLPLLPYPPPFKPSSCHIKALPLISPLLSIIFCCICLRSRSFSLLHLAGAVFSCDLPAVFEVGQLEISFLFSAFSLRSVGRSGRHHRHLTSLLLPAFHSVKCEYSLSVLCDLFPSYSLTPSFFLSPSVWLFCGLLSPARFLPPSRSTRLQLTVVHCWVVAFPSPLTLFSSFFPLLYLV